MTISTDEGDILYDPFCPCWDGSGLGYDGSGLNTGIDMVPLPIFTESSATYVGTASPTAAPAPGEAASDDTGGGEWDPMSLYCWKFVLF